MAEVHKTEEIVIVNVLASSVFPVTMLKRVIFWCASVVLKFILVVMLVWEMTTPCFLKSTVMYGLNGKTNIVARLAFTATDLISRVLKN